MVRKHHKLALLLRPDAELEPPPAPLPETTTMHDDDVGLVNCAGCRVPLLGERTARRLKKVPRGVWPEPARGKAEIAGRINDRPFCSTCARGYYQSLFARGGLNATAK